METRSFFLLILKLTHLVIYFNKVSKNVFIMYSEVWYLSDNFSFSFVFSLSLYLDCNIPKLNSKDTLCVLIMLFHAGQKKIPSTHSFPFINSCFYAFKNLFFWNLLLPSNSKCANIIKFLILNIWYVFSVLLWRKWGFIRLANHYILFLYLPTCQFCCCLDFDDIWMDSAFCFELWEGILYLPFIKDSSVYPQLKELK